MFVIVSILYYYINCKIFTKEKKIVEESRVLQDGVEDTIIILKKDNNIIKKFKILDKETITLNKYKTNIYKKLNLPIKSNTSNTSNTFDILDNSDLYYEYKGYRYLSSFPKKWIDKIDKYDNIGLECLQCLHYCCITKEGHLPLFLGFCEKCYKHFTVNTSYSNDCNDCEDCESTDDCAYCNCDGDKCITNVIDLSTVIIRTLYYHKNNKIKINNLILKLYNEYENLNVV